MFGHQDHDDPTNQDNQPAPTAAPQPDATLGDNGAAAITPPVTSAPAIDEHAGSGYIETASPYAAPTSDMTTATEPAAPAVSDVAAPDANDLLDLKQDALQKLSPLLGHLDQTPEEKFRTTMMMIQASDDQSLLKAAYEAAQGIEDEKVRAQALLDVVNEINYFTQAAQDQQDQ